MSDSKQRQELMRDAFTEASSRDPKTFVVTFYDLAKSVCCGHAVCGCPASHRGSGQQGFPGDSSISSFILLLVTVVVALVGVVAINSPRPPLHMHSCSPIAV